MGAVVADEDFLAIIHDDTVRKLEVFRTAKLVQDVAHLVEDDDAHHLTLHDDDPALVVDGDAARVLEDVRPELANELPVLVVDLYLVRRAALGHDDISRRLDNGDAVWIQQLPVALAALPELELEATFAIEDLNPVIVRVRDDYVVLRVHSDAARLRELSLHDAELAELAVVDHLLSFDLRLWRVDVRRDQLRRDVHHRVGARREYVAVLEYVVGHATARPFLIWVACYTVSEERVGGWRRREAGQARVRRKVVLRVKQIARVEVVFTTAVRLRLLVVTARQRHRRSRWRHRRVPARRVGRHLLHAGTWTSAFSVRLSNIPERVPDSHLYRLVVRDEFYVEGAEDVCLGRLRHDTLQLRVERLLEHQNLRGARMSHELLNERRAAEQTLDRFGHALRHRAQRHLLGVIGRVEFLQRVLLAILQHRSVEVKRIVDLVLGLVVMNLEVIRRMFDVLRQPTHLAGFGFRPRAELLQRFDLAVRHLAQVVVLVAARVLHEGAFLADRNVARLAEESQHLGAMLGAV